LAQFNNLFSSFENVETTNSKSENSSEDFPLEEVPKENRKSFWSLTSVLLGFTFFTATMWVGGTLGTAFKLFPDLLMIITIGNLLLGGYVAALGYISYKSGLNTVMMGRFCFGEYGSKIIDLILGVTQIGWYAWGTATIAIILTEFLGIDRTQKNMIGAISGSAIKSAVSFDKKDYGAKWFTAEKLVLDSKVIEVSASDSNISKIIAQANSRDILELSDGIYKIENSLVIDKKIIIKAKNQSGEVNLVYSGAKSTAMFEMHPKGNLFLDNVSLIGESEQFTFAPLEKNMSFSYNLNVEGSLIQNFKQVLKAYKGSFADSISFSKSILKNCANGIELAAETNDKGDYNAEFVSINNCTFENIQKEVINFYRGGYDESTIGGNLLVLNSLFKNCGTEETSKILLKTRGIINVNISNNTFENNSVKLVALLWGEKNNIHSENKIIESGEIRVELYLKQKLVY
jgi:Permease for cytosine/purines, uracil, thiamine, allantoin